MINYNLKFSNVFMLTLFSEPADLRPFIRNPNRFIFKLLKYFIAKKIDFTYLQTHTHTHTHNIHIYIYTCILYYTYYYILFSYLGNV